MKRLSGGGQLVYLVGPSGAGKDSLLRYARARTAGASAAPILFAHRYITRPVAGDEDHVPLTAQEFVRRREIGDFALHWSSNGLLYGIGIEMDSWLRRGVVVVVNGSRAHLAEARARYPRLCCVWVSADEAILQARLTSRGREGRERVAERIERTRRMPKPPQMPDLSIVNDGLLETAGDCLVAFLLERALTCACTARQSLPGGERRRCAPPPVPAARRSGS